MSAMPLGLAAPRVAALAAALLVPGAAAAGAGHEPLVRAVLQRIAPDGFPLSASVLDLTLHHHSWRGRLPNGTAASEPTASEVSLARSGPSWPRRGVRAVRRAVSFLANYADPLQVDVGTEESDLDALTLLLAESIFIAVWVTLTLLVAYYYDRTKLFSVHSDPTNSASLDGKWKDSFFDCFSDPHSCCFTCLCFGIRWADNLRISGLQGFWHALTMFILVMVLYMLRLPFILPILLVLQVYYRQRLRRLFDIDPGSCASVSGDCCLYCCCPLCAICQEARHVEEARAVRHPAVQPSHDVDAAAPPSTPPDQPLL